MKSETSKSLLHTHELDLLTPSFTQWIRFQVLKGAKGAIHIAGKHTTQEEQMLKRSIFAILTRLLYSHLPYTINNHEHMSCFMQLYNRMTEWQNDFTTECVQTHDDVKHIFNKITEFSFPSILLVQNKFSISFSKPAGCGNILNFIQIDNWRRFYLLTLLWPWIKVKVY